MQMTLSAMGGMLLKMLRPGWCGGGKRGYSFVRDECKGEDFGTIGKWMKEGKVRAVIDRVYPFERVSEALEALRKGRTVEKLVVRAGDHEN